jgi:bifunctional enzyme CysN/CysC/sulfate adenylyltransferase subunit 1
LEHDIDISRGSMLVGLDANLPGSHTEMQAEICWMHSRPLQVGKKYFLKHTTNTVQVAVTEIVNKLNLDTLDTEAGPTELAMNDIGEIRLRAAKPLVFVRVWRCVSILTLPCAAQASAWAAGRGRSALMPKLRRRCCS